MNWLRTESIHRQARRGWTYVLAMVGKGHPERACGYARIEEKSLGCSEASVDVRDYVDGGDKLPLGGIRGGLQEADCWRKGCAGCVVVRRRAGGRPDATPIMFADCREYSRSIAQKSKRLEFAISDEGCTRDGVVVATRWSQVLSGCFCLAMEFSVHVALSRAARRGWTTGWWWWWWYVARRQSTQGG